MVNVTGRFRILIGLCGFLLLAPGFSARGDTVMLAAADGEKTTRLSGEIVDFTGETLILRNLAGREANYDAGRVVAIETVWRPAHLQADRLFASRRFGDALLAYRQALEEEKRTWAQRRVLVRMSLCYANLNEPLRAGKTMLIVTKSDPQTPDLHALPLAWKTTEPVPELAAEAEKWLAGESAAEKLLGASWLLSGSQRAAAAAALEKITLDQTAPRGVAQLAQAQLWRIKAVQASAATLENWRHFLTQLPQSLRGGPSFVLAGALARSGQGDEAALAYLQTALLHGDDDLLASSALLEAGKLLQKNEKLEEARRAYLQLTHEFAGTSAAVEGSARLESLAP